MKMVKESVPFPSAAVFRGRRDTLPETCPHCGYIEVRDWTQDDGFCPNCGDRMDGNG